MAFAKSTHDYITAATLAELENAQKHGKQYKNLAEFYGAVTEEYMELIMEIATVKDDMLHIFRVIHGNETEPEMHNTLDDAQKHAQALAMEALQVAACCAKLRRYGIEREERA